MKRIILTSIVLLQIAFLAPCNAHAQADTKTFTRESGYIIRPEFLGAVLAEFGYQYNPNIQGSLGFGVEIGLDDGVVMPEFVLGVRAYATENKWTAFVDYHIGMLLLTDIYAAITHRFTAGPSYKNLDFGIGVGYAKFEGVGMWDPCINIGYNFRFTNKK